MAGTTCAALRLLKRCFGFVLPYRKVSAGALSPVPAADDHEVPDLRSLEELMEAAIGALRSGDGVTTAHHVDTAKKRFGKPAVDRYMEARVAAALATQAPATDNNKDTPR